MLSVIIKFRLGEGWAGSIWNGKWPGKSRKVNFIPLHKRRKSETASWKPFPCFWNLENIRRTFLLEHPLPPRPLSSIFEYWQILPRNAALARSWVALNNKSQSWHSAQKASSKWLAYLNHIFVLAVWVPKGEKNLWRYPKEGRQEGGDYQIKVGRGVSRCKAGLSRGSKAHTVCHLLLGISLRLWFCFWVVSRTVFTRRTITMS